MAQILSLQNSFPNIVLGGDDPFSTNSVVQRRLLGGGVTLAADPGGTIVAPFCIEGKNTVAIAGAAGINVARIRYSADANLTGGLVGVNLILADSGSADFGAGGMLGLSFVVTHASSATLDVGAGMSGSFQSSGSAGTITLGYGANAEGIFSGTGAVTTFAALRGKITTSAATITTGIGLWIEAPAISGSGAITNSFGIKQDGSEVNRLIGPLQTSATPATTGQIRLANTQGIHARNAANTGNLVLVNSDVNDVVGLGAAVLVDTVNSIVQVQTKFYPPDEAGGIPQNNAAIYAGSGGPNASNGANGDFYFRSDGAALTTIYHKRAGAWVGVV
jgi:hypothetical protein